MVRFRYSNSREIVVIVQIDAAHELRLAAVCNCLLKVMQTVVSMVVTSVSFTLT